MLSCLNWDLLRLKLSPIFSTEINPISYSLKCILTWYFFSFTSIICTSGSSYATPYRLDVIVHAVVSPQTVPFFYPTKPAGLAVSVDVPVQLEFRTSDFDSRRWRRLVSFSLLPIYPKGLISRFSLDRRTYGSQCRCGHSGKEDRVMAV